MTEALIFDAIRTPRGKGKSNGSLPRDVVFLDELPRNPTGKVLKRRPVVIRSRHNRWNVSVGPHFRAIAEALERPRFDVYFPRVIGRIGPVMGLLPRSAREGLGD